MKGLNCDFPSTPIALEINCQFGLFSNRSHPLSSRSPCCAGLLARYALRDLTVDLGRLLQYPWEDPRRLAREEDL